MPALKKQQYIVDLLKHALFNVEFAAKEEQKVTHTKGYSDYYAKALDHLNTELRHSTAVLNRIKVLGK